MWKQLLKNKFHSSVSSFHTTLSQWHFFNHRIVFTNGCFDLLHLGHLSYLMQAKDLGDKLIIGLNSDASVTRLKGPHRPVNSQETRGMLLAAFGFVDAVIVFEEDTPEQLIQQISPAVLVKGKDYENKFIAGAEAVKSKGGEVILLDYLPSFSTTSLLEKIREAE